MLMANDKNAMDNVRIASTAWQMQGSASIVISSIQVNAMLDESIVMIKRFSKTSDRGLFVGSFFERPRARQVPG